MYILLCLILFFLGGFLGVGIMCVIQFGAKSER
ncbi:DUF3789 domain-containing protein [Enterococcus faecium]|nr:DUF3789 domain-containing protein [Enterococcus faecium]